MSKKLPGTNCKPAGEKDPDFVLAKIGFHRQTFIEFLKAQDGEWFNAEMLTGQYGPYLKKQDSLSKTATQQSQSDDEGMSDDIPF